MPSKEISNYFEVTENRATREDLKSAVILVEGEKIAIDCGCGAGSDIAFLRSKDFYVYAFDIEGEAIERCHKRFSADKNVNVTQSTFFDFHYPQASLVLADSSLFFCPGKQFHTVWDKIVSCLLPTGIFVGSFLGHDDTMAGPSYKKGKYWAEVFVTSENQIKDWLVDFDIVSFNEHKTSGLDHDGVPHQWHIFSVVARKK